MRTRVLFLCAFFLALSAAAESVDTLTPPYSWRGINGQGRFPAGTLVTEFWDIAQDATFKDSMRNKHKTGILDRLPHAKAGTQKNIVWRTTLPNWGQNTPIVMGDKVFVMTEGGWKSDTAELICLSAEDGKILWQKPVDRMDAWPEPQQSEGKAKRAMEIKRWQTYFHYWNRLMWNNDTSTLANLEKAPFEAIRSEAAQAGWTFPEHGKLKVNRICDCGNGTYRKRYGVKEAPSELQANYKNLAKDRIHMREGWTSEGPWYGNTMGPVVGDGKHVYAITALGDAAAYDTDGKRLWALDIGVPFVKSGPPTCHMQPNHVSWAAPSLALLADDEEHGASSGRVLVWFSNEAQSFYGIDAEAGKVLWTTPTPVRYSSNSYVPNGTPVLLRLQDGGKPVTVAVSSHGMVVRVCDGSLVKVLGEGIHAIDPGAVVPFGGSFLSWVGHGDVLVACYASKAGKKRARGVTAAVRLAFEDGALKEGWLWRGEATALKSNLIFHEGSVCSGDNGFKRMDATTGKLINGSKRSGAMTGGGLCGAPFTGTQIIGGKGGSRTDALWASFAITSYPEMDNQGRGLLMVPWPTGEIAERHIATRGASVLKWGAGFTIAPWGNRIFIRNNDYMWCIGDSDQPYVPPEHYLK